METFVTERGPIQSVASVHFSHRPLERENSSAAQVKRNRPEFHADDPVVVRIDATDLPSNENALMLLPVLIQESRLSSYTPSLLGTADCPGNAFFFQRLAGRTSTAKAFRPTKKSKRWAFPFPRHFYP